jgi:hypothetical protein
MSKLSTQMLLKHVCLSNEYTTAVATSMAKGVFNPGKNSYEPEPDKTSKEYLDGLKDAMNPKLWKRCSKERLFMEPKNERLGRKESFYDIGIVDYGEINEPILAKALHSWNDSGQIKKYLPIHRKFEFSKYMGADYMMDIWTTYDDIEIIGWSVQLD